MWRRKKFLLGALLAVALLVGTTTGVAFASGNGDESQANQPTVTEVVPTSVVRGQTLDVVISGTNLTGATAVSFSGTGMTVNNYLVDSATQITANVSIARDAALGARDVSVTNAVGTGTLSGGFTVKTQQEALLDRACAIYEENTGVAIDPEQLQVALDQARSEMQDEALKSWLQNLVDEGKITQEEADQYLEWWQARPDITSPGTNGYGHGGGMNWGWGDPYCAPLCFRLSGRLIRQWG